MVLAARPDRDPGRPGAPDPLRAGPRPGRDAAVRRGPVARDAAGRPGVGAADADPDDLRWPAGGAPYGAGLWVEDEAVCFGAGWAGQLLLCRPSDGLVVVTQSDPGFAYGPPRATRCRWTGRRPALVRELLLGASH